MDDAALLSYCLAKPGAWQDEPWEGDVVAKVGDKIFAFLGATSVGLKCGRTREEADELVRVYPEDVSASAYIGRYGWNVIRSAARSRITNCTSWWISPTRRS
ncbi:MmcQ/YjbR family DNA-binding protein [Nocardia sp. NPDC004085]